MDWPPIAVNAEPTRVQTEARPVAPHEGSLS